MAQKTLISLLVILLSIPLAFAQESSSSNFILRDFNANVSAGESSSSSFSNISISGDSVNSESSSTFFSLKSGTLDYTDGNASLTQQTYRFFQNQNSLTPGTALAAENTSHTNIRNGDILRLRISLKASGNIFSATNSSFKIQYAAKAAEITNCSDLHTSLYNDVGGLNSNIAWIGFDNSSVSDGATLASTVLSTTQTNGTAQSYEETNDSTLNPRSIFNSGEGEWDWVLKYNSSNNGKTYCFRMVYSNNSILNSYQNYPRASILLSETSSTTTEPVTQSLGGNTNIISTSSISAQPQQVIFPKTNLNLSGRWAPKSTLILLIDGKKAAQTRSDDQGLFQFLVSDLAIGKYQAAVYGIDQNNIKSTAINNPIEIKKNEITKLENIIPPPTFIIDKSTVKLGDPLIISGFGLSESAVTVFFKARRSISLNLETNETGRYIYNFDSNEFRMTKYEVSASTEKGPVSRKFALNIGKTNIYRSKNVLKGDLNQDQNVDLADFSILSFWYKKDISQNSAAKKADLNADNKVDLADFSILASFWTASS